MTRQKLCLKRGVTRQKLCLKRGVTRQKLCLKRGVTIGKKLCQKYYFPRRRSVKVSLSCFSLFSTLSLLLPCVHMPKTIHQFRLPFTCMLRRWVLERWCSSPGIGRNIIWLGKITPKAREMFQIVFTKPGRQKKYCALHKKLYRLLFSYFRTLRRVLLFCKKPVC